MSTTVDDAIGDRLGGTVTPAWAVRRLALLAAVGLLASFLWVLWGVTTIVGGRAELLAVAAVAFLGATASARWLPPRVALGIGVGGLVAGGAAYGWVMPRSVVRPAILLRAVGDLYVLLSGNLSLVGIVAADTGAISLAPAPVYLTWYFALRRRYDLAALAGGSALAFLVLSGDAAAGPTLWGAVSLLAMLGLGSFESVDADWRQLQDLGLVLLGVVVLTRLVRLVPASGVAEPPSAGSGPGEVPSLESGLLGADDQAGIYGSVSLSPAARFEVTADRPALWHAAAYDRYTGNNWVRSGESRLYRPRELGSPPGAADRLVQTFEAASEVASLPAAWRPVEFDDPPPTRMQVTSEGSLRPERSLRAGYDYRVVSAVPDWDADRLREAGTDYPDAVAGRYLRTPDDLTARVARKADEVAGDAPTPYDAAVRLSRWLQANKGYSLSVTKPEGDVVDGFLFAMTDGYCVYFATAMAVMLRTLGIPTRYATGYTPGERVGEDRWVVRGYNAHAWVEVFFPGVGWVPFDPTPGGSRRQSRRERLQRAREAGATDVDPAGVDETDTPTPTETPTPTPTAADDGNGTDVAADPGEVTPEVGQAAGGGDVEFSPEAEATPTPRQGIAADDAGVTTPAEETDLVRERTADAGGRDRLSLLAGAAGLVLGAYRFRLLQRGYEQLRLRYQPREDPETDVVRAFDRLELLLARRHRARREDETPRTYLRSLDDEAVDRRVHRVGELYERARYGGDLSRDEADEAVELVDELVAERARGP